MQFEYNNEDKTPKSFANCSIFGIKHKNKKVLEMRISARENTRIISSEALKDRQLKARI